MHEDTTKYSKPCLHVHVQRAVAIVHSRPILATKPKILNIMGNIIQFERKPAHSLAWKCEPLRGVSLLQAADGGGAGGGAAAGQPDPHAAAAGGLPEDRQPAGYPGPAVPAEQLSVRPAEPAALDREHRQDQQRVGLRVESTQDLQLEGARAGAC